jgi:hypothetical protein
LFASPFTNPLFREEYPLCSVTRGDACLPKVPAAGGKLQASSADRFMVLVGSENALPCESLGDVMPMPEARADASDATNPWRA